MTWNYRLLEFSEVAGQKWYQICEVYYDEQGKPEGWGDAGEVMWEDDEGGAEIGKLVLERMKMALARPVLVVQKDESLLESGPLGPQDGPRGESFEQQGKGSAFIPSVDRRFARYKDD